MIKGKRNCDVGKAKGKKNCDAGVSVTGNQLPVKEAFGLSETSYWSLETGNS